MGRIAGGSVDDTRRRLLDAAAAEFHRRGFEGARVADIAAGADLSNGALYRHFASKSDLLSAALTKRGAEEMAGLFARSEGGSLADLLTAVGRTLDRLPPGRGGLMVEALAASRRDPEVAAVSSRHLTDAENWLSGLIADAQREGVVDLRVDSRALARFCVTLLLGAALMSAADLAPLGDGWAELIGRIADAVGRGRPRR